VTAVKVHGDGEGDLVREADGSVTRYDDLPVTGDTVARLLTELFSGHWADITFGPIIEGSAWEIRLTSPPTLTIRDGYLTVDTGPWHFHLCVDDHHARGDEELARVRRVARAAFFRTDGGTCVPTSWGLRLWNGRGEQMITVFFPSPFYDAATDTRRREPEWSRTALWEDFRARWAVAPTPAEP
jgi:hypothetical protein